MKKEKLLWHETLFLRLLYFSYFLYALTFIAKEGFKLDNLANYLRLFIKLYVGLILVVKYNPITGKHKFSKFDRRLAYQSGMFLLISTSISLIFDKPTNKDSTSHLKNLINKFYNNNINETNKKNQ